MKTNALTPARLAGFVVFALLVGPIQANDDNRTVDELSALYDSYQQQQALKAARAEVDKDKFGFVVSIADDLEKAAHARGFGDDWRAEFENKLIGLSAGELIAVAGSDPADVLGKRLGSRTNDLVFTPVPPCRIYDSREAMGDLGGRRDGGTDTTISTRLYGPEGPGSSLGVQGGNPGGCGMPDTDPGAIAFNLTVTGYQGSGLVTVYPAFDSLPLASTINYKPDGLIAIANGTIVEQCVDCGNPDIMFRVEGAGTHVIIDVVGFFDAPERTELDTMVVHEIFTAPVFGDDEVFMMSPDCPAGYALTGGGFDIRDQGDLGGSPGDIDELLDADSLTDHFMIAVSRPWGLLNEPPSRWECAGLGHDLSLGGINLGFRCYAVCARVPGRNPSVGSPQPRAR